MYDTGCSLVSSVRFSKGIKESGVWMRKGIEGADGRSGGKKPKFYRYFAPADTSEHLQPVMSIHRLEARHDYPSHNIAAFPHIICREINRSWLKALGDDFGKTVSEQFISLSTLASDGR